MKTTPLRVAIGTLGCRSNYADSFQLQAALSELGAVPCQFSSAADVYVLNTCTVTDAADKEALKLIRQVRSQSPKAKVIVTGCLAEARKDWLSALDGVDAVVGLGQLDFLMQLIMGDNASKQSSAAQQLAISPLRNERGNERGNEAGKQLNQPSDRLMQLPLKRPLSSRIPGPRGQIGELKVRARYHLRVQDGCTNFCTFCIIPKIKGKLVSRPLNDILADIEYLARAGYQEVVISGTHLGAYGRDLGSNLKTLLRALAKKSAVGRIRISSLDPNDLDRETIEILAENQVFCRHLHLCLQSLSDVVLKRMNRRYRVKDSSELLCYIEQRMPDCCIGADLIAGFPGESRQEVDKAKEAFLGLPISYLHVFPYSEREGTAAVRLDGQVALEQRRKRAAAWREIGENRRKEFHQRFLGKELEVIVERLKAAHAWGTSREYLPVKIALSENNSAGSLLDIGKELSFAVGDKISVRAVAYSEAERKLLCRI